jgi:D-psicose/D-tagatose/L-ribulose 3-epimerase
VHLAAHTWPRSEPLETTARRVAALGYSAVVLTGEPDLYDPERAAAVLAAEGLSCWGAASVMAGERNLAAAEPARRAATVGYLQDVVRLVGAAGGHVLTIVPVTVGLLEPAGSARDEWEWLVEGLRAVDEEAARCGVTLALEPINRFETYLLNRAEQALALAEAVGDRCGVCLDTFHLNIEEVHLHAAIRLVGDRLASVDVADNNRMAPGLGALDWAGIVETFAEVGYSGALAVEYLPPLERAPVGDAWRGGAGEDLETSDFVRLHGSGSVPEGEYTALAARSAATLLPLLREREPARSRHIVDLREPLRVQRAGARTTAGG